MSVGVFIHKLRARQVARRRQYTQLACILAVVAYAQMLAGCDYFGARFQITRATKPDISARLESRTAVPLPAPELLEPQIEPKCEFTTSDPNIDELRKLDYERQCYRHAEMIVRNRLESLQSAVDETIKALKRNQERVKVGQLKFFVAD